MGTAPPAAIRRPAAAPCARRRSPRSRRRRGRARATRPCSGPSEREALGDEALAPGADRETVRPPGEIVDDARGQRRDARRQLLRVLAEPVEQPAQDALDLRVLLARPRAEIDALEH